MIEILITACKPAPNLSFSSLIMYLKLGRVTHLQSLYPKRLQKRAANAISNLPLHYCVFISANCILYFQIHHAYINFLSINFIYYRLQAIKLWCQPSFYLKSCLFRKDYQFSIYDNKNIYD